MELDKQDLKTAAIVGKYKTYKMMSYINDKMDFFTKEEIAADLEKKLADGLIEQRNYNQSMSIFDSITEFTADNKVYLWTPLPDDISEDEIKQIADSGEILINGKMFCNETKEWKIENGQYYYNTKEHREVFGEQKSPWDKIELDSENRIQLEVIIIEKIS